MSPQVALWGLAWLSIVVCYLALLVMMRELRMLRVQVLRLAAAPVHPAVGTTTRLPTSLVGGERRVVLAAETRCPLCRITLNRLAQQVSQVTAEPILLTHETPATWHDVPAGVSLVHDEAAWEQIGHLVPPILMDVAPDGTVTDLVLVSNESDVDTALARWALRG